MHCGRFLRPISRRQMLATCANGFGAAALAVLAGDRAFAGTTPSTAAFAPRPSHYKPKAKACIFLYMDGGPSQMDTFDPKPLLTAEHGQPFKMKMEPTQFDNNGNTFGSP